MSILRAKDVDIVLEKDFLRVEGENILIQITENDDIFINVEPDKKLNIKKTFKNVIGKIDLKEETIFNDVSFDNCTITYNRTFQKDIDCVSVVIKNSLIDDFLLFDYKATEVYLINNLNFVIENSSIFAGRIILASKNLNLGLINFTRKYDRKLWNKVCSSNLVYYCTEKENINYNNQKIPFVKSFDEFIKEILAYEEVCIKEEEEKLLKQKEKIKMLKEKYLK